MKIPRKKRNGFAGSFYSMLSTAFIMCALMFVLIAVAKNVIYTSAEASVPLLDIPKSQVSESSGRADTLLIYEDDAMGSKGLEEMTAILSQMKIPCDILEHMDAPEQMPEKYDYLVLSVTHYQYLGTLLGNLKDWVKSGGNLMILYPPEINGSFESLFDLLGIRDCGSSNVYVGALRFAEDFLLGGASGDFPIMDGYQSAMGAFLEEDCQVFAQTTDEHPIPIIWRHRIGQGTVVVDNLGILEKSCRGFHSSAFSLLSDVCIYPVINAAAFYIDDFPSPVPDGYAAYIQRDYQLSTRDFYTSRWWPDVYNLAQEYGIKYTGLVIEEYSDHVDAPFERNTDRERYQYFGNMLMDAGGEIGLHGYNHMPLVLENFSYEGLFDSYTQWPSYGDMHDAVCELTDFCKALYPDQTFQVYVPPSNIISQEGINMLAAEFTEVKTIASVYIPGELAYTQEFCVEENGIISTPRVISGYLMNDYVRLLALSELNFHLVSSHFQHPDDVLDAERGAELGWAQMYENLSDYTRWLYTSVPAIRSLTGSEMAAAVQRYDYVNLERTETEQGLHLELSNFYDEAWFVMRLNEGQEVADISGGEITKLNGTLYLVCAREDQVELYFS